MRNFKNELETDIRFQQNLLKQYAHELETLPPGYLAVYRCGKYVYRKYTIYESGRRIQRNLKPQETKLAAALCRKVFLKKQTQVMQQNLRAQEQLRKVYRSYDVQTILAEINPVYAEGIPLVTEHAELRRKQEAAQKKALHPERLTQITVAGIYVRSKSETIIVNLMSGNRIRFVYEEPLTLEIPGRGRITLYPDFTIYLDSGEIIIWEHLGMLSNDGYAEAQIKKLQIYHQAGYTLGKNLILTADNADGTLDVTVISKIIEDLCRQGACY